MSTLRDIRQRLRSIENIKKITDTMERVAAARLRHAQAKAEQSRPYISKMKDILEKVASTEISHPLFEQREAKKIGVVIIAADRGLSGSYNANVFATADDFLKKYNPEQVELFLFGRKAIDYYHRRQWKVHDRYPNWADHTSIHQVSIFSDQLVNAFLSHQLDEVWLIYTQYISVMRRHVSVEKFLNIGKDEFEHKYVKPPKGKKREREVAPPPKALTHSLNYIFEPSADEVLGQILPRYCMTRIQTALFESHASELAARIVAMQTASKNSEEMITDLTLVKNKTRQRDITREMIEITSGSESLK